MAVLLSWIGKAKHDSDKANEQVDYNVLHDTRLLKGIFWICRDLAFENPCILCPGNQTRLK